MIHLKKNLLRSVLWLKTWKWLQYHFVIFYNHLKFLNENFLGSSQRFVCWVDRIKFKILTHCSAFLITWYQLNVNTYESIKEQTNGECFGTDKIGIGVTLEPTLRLEQKLIKKQRHAFHIEKKFWRRIPINCCICSKLLSKSKVLEKLVSKI